MDRPRLRDLHHPDLSELLVHFTGRPRQRNNLPEEIRKLDARQRLESILIGQTITAMNTYFAPVVPVVCFTESTRAGVRYMLASAGFAPWGIVFHREKVFAEGGGPVFHLRGDEYEHRKALPERIQSRVVKFAPGEAEWVEEREWRVPYEDPDEDPHKDGQSGFEFDRDEVQALIVGDANWPPPEYVEHLEHIAGDWVPVVDLAPPAWLPDCPLWVWDSFDLRFD